MSDQLQSTLKRLFDRHRIVFWYDAARELKNDFDALSMDGVEKLEIVNNEFGLKHRILRQEPKQRFLLYQHGPKPRNEDNWLLDVLLAEGELRTDQAAIWLSELGLGPEFGDLVSEHAEFFGAEKRKQALAKMLKGDDVASALRLKMLAVCAGAEPRIDSLLEHLFQELADDRDEKQRLIQRCGLEGFLWKQLERYFGYRSDNPGLRDFVVELFKSAYAHGTNSEMTLTDDALVLLKRWKDSRRFAEGFETLSAECAGVLGIEQDLLKRDFRQLLELDYFELIDRKIIHDLVHAVAERAWAPGEIIAWVQQRRPTHWYANFASLYEALEAAAAFVRALDESELGMESLADGYRRYHQTWYKLDAYYRRFIHHLRSASQASLMGPLADQIENLYVNNYLLPVNDRWQVYVDRAERWAVPDAIAQQRFFDHWVQRYLDQDFRICVIISDALRYEVGADLQRRILGEDRYDCRIEPMLSQLPSYTQLGMASLLPHQALEIEPKKGASVLVDGQSATGTANRDKILKKALDGQAEATTFDVIMGLNKDDLRERLKGARVLYVYHNQVDRVGDKRDSEGQVFQAAEDAQDDLLKLVKKLANNNVANILITADHGFL
ncbi:MAG: BREX-1 system phosphatase PglZ type A, partial [Spiribacter salinus]